MIGCWCDKAFVAEVDAVRGVLSRSQFCRDALREKLEHLGIAIDAAIAHAPDRSGKGRRPSRRTGYPAPAKPFQLNEAAAVDPGESAAGKGDARQRGVKRRPRPGDRRG
jgi:hypothetical protein